MATQFIESILRIIEEFGDTLYAKGIPAEKLTGQVPASVLPPGSGGGSGLPALTEGDLIYGDAGGDPALLPIGDPGFMLYSNGTAPIWDVQPPPSGAATGDLDGTYPAPIVDGIQGRSVINVAPNDGDVLTWNDGGQFWEPVAPSGGGGGGAQSRSPLAPTPARRAARVTATSGSPVIHPTPATAQAVRGAGGGTVARSRCQIARAWPGSTRAARR
jgi:hypothetical protein